MCHCISFIVSDIVEKHQLVEVESPTLPSNFSALVELKKTAQKFDAVKKFQNYLIFVNSNNTLLLP